MNTLKINPSEVVEIYSGPAFDIRNTALSCKIVGLSTLNRNRDYSFILKFDNLRGKIYSRPLILAAPGFYVTWRFSAFDEILDMGYGPYARVTLMSEANNERDLTLQFFFLTRND